MKHIIYRLASIINAVPRHNHKEFNFCTRLAIYIAIYGIVVVGNCSCSKEIKNHIKLSSTRLDLKIGETERLVASSSSGTGQILWSSADENIAKVDKLGRVSAISEGETRIKAESEGVIAECEVHVSKSSSYLILNESYHEITRKETFQLEIVHISADLKEMNIKWESSDTDIIEVNDTGFVTAKAIGNATISASAGTCKAECVFNVTGIKLDSISFRNRSFDMKVGEMNKIEYKLVPEDTDFTAVKFTSETPQTASVSHDGEIRALAIGQTIIKVEAGNYIDILRVNVESQYNIGDFYYSDGAISDQIINGKEPIGIIFWTGNPSLSDPKLLADHPECKNGLVVSIKDMPYTPWQSNSYTFSKAVSSWIQENLVNFEGTLINYDDTEQLSRTLGYNNTSAIMEFNEANPDYIVEAVQNIIEFSKENDTPETSSGWYLPSIKELSLLARGDFDENIYWDNTGSRININIINQRINLIEGAAPIENILWSSTESNEFCTYYLDFSNGKISDNNKAISDMASQRFILAF